MFIKLKNLIKKRETQIKKFGFPPKKQMILGSEIPTPPQNSTKKDPFEKLVINRILCTSCLRTSKIPLHLFQPTFYISEMQKMQYSNQQW